MASTPLAQAVELIGNANKLATLINRRQSTVWDWLRRGWPAPDACPAIEEATGGRIKAAQLLEPAMKAKRERTKRRKAA